MDEGFGGADSGLAAAPLGDDFVVLAPDALAVLADVGEQGGFFIFQHRGDVHVGVGQEALRLGAGIDFEEIKLRAFPQSHPAANGQQARDLMVQVRIHRPVGEEHIGLFVGEQFGHGLDVGAVDFRRAIDLPEESGLGAHDLAGLLAFRAADFAGLLQTLVTDAPFPASEVNHGYRVAQFGIASQGTRATGFGIIRVAAHANHFKFLPGLGGGQGQGRRRNRGQERPGQEAGPVEERSAGQYVLGRGHPLRCVEDKRKGRRDTSLWRSLRILGLAPGTPFPFKPIHDRGR